jgi:hypothetical protein
LIREHLKLVGLNAHAMIEPAGGSCMAGFRASPGSDFLAIRARGGQARQRNDAQRVRLA